MYGEGRGGEYVCLCVLGGGGRFVVGVCVRLWMGVHVCERARVRAWGVSWRARVACVYVGVVGGVCIAVLADCISATP